MKITQKLIDNFSNTTYDDYWLHKSNAKDYGSPFNKSIAHGLLILSLLPKFKNDIGFNNKINKKYNKYIKNRFNYGFNKVRFISPVISDNQIRAKFILKNVTKGKKRNTIKFVFDTIVQNKHYQTDNIDNCLVAQWLSMIVYK